MVNYKLVNPVIRGELKSTVSSDNINDAADKIWNKISAHITNDVPNFAFSIKDMSDDSLYHFQVSEKKTGNKHGDRVTYNIKQLKIKKENENKLKNSINAFEDSIQDGGNNFHEEDNDDVEASDDKFIGNLFGGKKRYKSYDDDDDSSSSEEELHNIYNKARLNNYMNAIQPITYWWYNPLAYELNTLYIPTFQVPLTPYVQMDFTTYWI